MNVSVVLRVENLLKEHGVNFEVVRHQQVFTSQEAAAPAGTHTVTMSTLTDRESFKPLFETDQPADRTPQGSDGS